MTFINQRQPLNYSKEPDLGQAHKTVEGINVFEGANPPLTWYGGITLRHEKTIKISRKEIDTNKIKHLTKTDGCFVKTFMLKMGKQLKKD